MTIERLTQLQYSSDRKGPWKLYIYEANSEYHQGGVWFEQKPRYPDEQITSREAFERTLRAIARGREVRVCDSGDMLVYHSKDGNVLHGTTFWSEIWKAA